MMDDFVWRAAAAAFRIDQLHCMLIKCGLILYMHFTVYASYSRLVLQAYTVYVYSAAQWAHTVYVSYCRLTPYMHNTVGLYCICLYCTCIQHSSQAVSVIR